MAAVKKIRNRLLKQIRIAQDTKRIKENAAEFLNIANLIIIARALFVKGFIYLAFSFTKQYTIMNIGYDGKRAYQNKTGLGNYIRSLIAILTQHYPQHNYTLFAPRQTELFDAPAFKNARTVFPETFAGKQFPGWWRRRGIVKAIAGSDVDIYHGVSNELPVNIEHTGIKTVVTVHDIIFERFPKTYHFEERYVHRHKIKQACKYADAVIAISKQTKADLIASGKLRG